MKIWLAIGLAIAIVLAAGAATQLSAQGTPAPRVSSPGLRPAESAPNPSFERRKRAVAPAADASPFPTDMAPLAEGQSVEEGGDLDLMCFGGGSANKADVATAWGWNSFGSSGATIVGQRSQGFDDQVSLRIHNGEGRLRMPRTMLPAIRGGEDGWFKLNDIRYKQNEITASVGVNPFNNPKLRLDRYTGAISISGKAGDYAGQCRRFDPQQMQRQF